MFAEPLTSCGLVDDGVVFCMGSICTNQFLGRLASTSDGGRKLVAVVVQGVVGNVVDDADDDAVTAAGTRRGVPACRRAFALERRDVKLLWVLSMSSFTSSLAAVVAMLATPSVLFMITRGDWPGA